MPQIPINLCYEDEPSEAILRKLLGKPGKPFLIGTCFPAGGFGQLRKKIRIFNQAARVMPYFVLTDLDKAECAPILIKEWLPKPLRKNHNLIFRVAVREVESWLLADREAFAKFLKINEKDIPEEVDDIEDPKMFLIELAAKSTNRSLREDIVPRIGTKAKQGPNYNDRICEFIRLFWSVSRACKNSPSLRRTRKEIKKFKPVWPQ